MTLLGPNLEVSVDTPNYLLIVLRLSFGLDSAWRHNLVFILLIKWTHRRSSIKRALRHCGMLLCNPSCATVCNAQFSESLLLSCISCISVTHIMVREKARSSNHPVSHLQSSIDVVVQTLLWYHSFPSFSSTLPSLPFLPCISFLSHYLSFHSSPRRIIFVFVVHIFPLVRLDLLIIALPLQERIRNLVAAVYGRD